VHLLSETSSCSAFHVGHELFITAGHCLELDEEYIIRTDKDEIGSVTPILIDRDRDVAVFSSEGFEGSSLTLWNEEVYAKPPIGSSIMSMGFPGYYLGEFVFEEGRILDYRVMDGVKLIVSREMSYHGESGGPVISMHNGQVVGLVHALAERVMQVQEGVEVHRTLSLLIAWSEIRLVLEQARKLR
jgi:hypothetical protein